VDESKPFLRNGKVRSYVPNASAVSLSFGTPFLHNSSKKKNCVPNGGLKLLIELRTK
jgi:hypothetical protein